jgi:hypothetical protein
LHEIQFLWLLDEVRLGLMIGKGLKHHFVSWLLAELRIEWKAFLVVREGGILVGVAPSFE